MRAITALQFNLLAAKTQATHVLWRNFGEKLKEKPVSCGGQQIQPTHNDRRT